MSYGAATKFLNLCSSKLIRLSRHVCWWLWSTSVGRSPSSWSKERSCQYCSPTWMTQMMLTFNQVAWSCQVSFQLSSCLIKISILLFYRRLVQRTHSRFMQMAIYFAINFTIFYMIATVVLLFVVCLPTNSYWKSLDVSYTKPYKCINTTVLDPLIVALSVFSDFYSLIIPQIVIRQLQMARREKLMLYGIFASGFV